MIDRAELRGKPLDWDCHYAKTLIHAHGSTDNRELCYGLLVNAKDWIINPKCLECKAYLKNM